MPKPLSKPQKKRILDEVAAIAPDLKFAGDEQIANYPYDLIPKDGDPLAILDPGADEQTV